MQWRGDIDCVTSVGYGPVSTPRVDIFDTWVTVSSTGAVVPDGVVAARVYVNNLKFEDGGTFEVLADDLYLVADPLFEDDFESGATDGWSSVVGG